MPIELARLAPQTEALSVAEIYRAHVGDVTRWVSRLGGPRADLEDLVQEVFMRVQRHLSSFRGEAQLTTWLFQIAANVVRTHRRRERWRAILGRSPDVRRETVREPERSADEALAQTQAQQLVYRALDRMSDRYRTAIILFEIEDLPGEQVAELMGVSTANVWVLLHRARAELVKQVKAIHGDDG